MKREQYPSWLYPVKSGATTIWERWDGQTDLRPTAHKTRGGPMPQIVRVAGEILADQTKLLAQWRR